MCWKNWRIPWKRPKTAVFLQIFKGALGDPRSHPDPQKWFYSSVNRYLGIVKKFQNFFFSKIFVYNNFSLGGGGFHLPPAVIGLKTPNRVVEIIFRNFSTFFYWNSFNMMWDDDIWWKKSVVRPFRGLKTLFFGQKWPISGLLGSLNYYFDPRGPNFNFLKCFLG